MQKQRRPRGSADGRPLAGPGSSEPTCGSWASKPRATRPRPPCTTARPGCCRTNCYSQVALHAAYGGVVPELASRDHLRKLLPLLEKAVETGGGRARASTASPTPAARDSSGRCWWGPRWRAASPMPGACPASACTTWKATCWRPCSSPTRPPFPFVALLVSGGHTLLARVEGIGRYELLGSSLDDAAGEAFDKTAKLLGLGYPGGPQLAALAEQGRPDVFRFPRPLTDRPGLDFSLQRSEDRRRRRPAPARRTRRQWRGPTSPAVSRRPSSIRW